MLPLSWRSLLMVISDVISDGVIHCCVKRVLCSFVLVKSCKCNEDHLGFMKTYCSALGIRSNMAFLFLRMCAYMFACVTGSFSGVFLFACLPVLWKNGKLKWSPYLTHLLIVAFFFCFCFGCGDFWDVIPWLHMHSLSLWPASYPINC